MKKLYFLSLATLLLFSTSCTDNTLLHDDPDLTKHCETQSKEGMQRLIFQSPEDIKNFIAQNGPNDGSIRKSIGNNGACEMSDNEIKFVSLYEQNYNKLMESLTPEQIEEIANDEDELEYWPTDSVISDFQFQCLF